VFTIERDILFLRPFNSSFIFHSIIRLSLIYVGNKLSWNKERNRCRYNINLQFHDCAGMHSSTELACLACTVFQKLRVLVINHERCA
jgi:hypothetical protein